MMFVVLILQLLFLLSDIIKPTYGRNFLKNMVGRTMAPIPEQH